MCVIIYACLYLIIYVASLKTIKKPRYVRILHKMILYNYGIYSYQNVSSYVNVFAYLGMKLGKSIDIWHIYIYIYIYNDKIYLDISTFVYCMKVTWGYSIAIWLSNLTSWCMLRKENKRFCWVSVSYVRHLAQWLVSTTTDHGCQMYISVIAEQQPLVCSKSIETKSLFTKTEKNKVFFKIVPS